MRWCLFTLLSPLSAGDLHCVLRIRNLDFEGIDPFFKLVSICLHIRRTNSTSNVPFLYWHLSNIKTIYEILSNQYGHSQVPGLRDFCHTHCSSRLRALYQSQMMIDFEERTAGQYSWKTCHVQAFRCKMGCERRLSKISKSCLLCRILRNLPCHSP